MRITRTTRGLAATAALLAASWLAAPAQADGHRKRQPNEHTVFAHRGASGYRPEHTMGAYNLAIKQCADYIEPDLVMTRDGVLVDRHEPEISGTTDVAKHPEFASRKTTKSLDGTPTTGWFVEDFTLKELKTLRAVERLPEIRPANTAYNGRWDVPTFDEVLRLARKSKTCDGRQVGVIPEIKHSTYMHALGFNPEDAVLRALKRNNFLPNNSRVIVQSFEIGNLKYLHARSSYNLVQLIDCSGGPFDVKTAGGTLAYQDMVTPAGMKAIAGYATSVGMCKDLMIPRDAKGYLQKPTAAIGNAHAAGLSVTGWTFRRENNFLPADFRSSDKPAEIGDLAAEIRVFFNAGMDAVFSDNPDIAVKAQRNL